MDSPISKPALLRQTFELGAAYSGELLSLTKMLGSLQDAGNTATLAGYINLLGESGLLCGLQIIPVNSSLVDREVDFILRKKGSVVAIEVKSNAEKRTNGLDKFRQLFNPTASFIVGDGGIGAEDFLSMDIRKLF